MFGYHADWAVLTRAERDARYDNMGAVAGSQGYMAALRSASEAVRAAHPARLDLPYGPGARNRIDLIEGRADAPCLVFIHGGYWQRNSREGFTALGEGVRAHGWSVAFPGYTLTPDISLSGLVEELRLALGRLRGLVGGPIILAGWSAGGHLTAVLLGHAAIHAGLAISGVFELGPIRDTSLNDKARITEAEADLLSPLRQPATPKPLHLAYGSAELPPLVGDSRALHALRAAAHAPGALIPVAGANHFTVLEGLRAADGILTRAALDLAAGPAGIP